MPLHKDLTGADLHEPKPHAASHGDGGTDELSVADLADITAAGAALLDDADAAAQRATLGLGTVATLAVDTDSTMAADSDTRVPSQKAVKAAIAAGGGGGGSGSYVLLESHPASSSATLDFGTRNAAGQSGALIQSDFKVYVVKFIGVRPATDGVDLQMRMSVSASFITTNSYTWTKGTDSGSSTAAASSSGSVSFIQLGNSWNNTANWGINGEVTVYDPAGALHTGVVGALIGLNASTRFLWSLMGHFESTSAVDGFRFFFSSGNIASGTIAIFGVPS